VFQKNRFRAIRDELTPSELFDAAQAARAAGAEWLPLQVGAQWKLGQVLMPLPKYSQDKVETLRSLVESGDFRAVVDRTYPLGEVVEATRYVESDQKQGNVLLLVTAEPDTR